MKISEEHKNLIEGLEAYGGRLSEKLTIIEYDCGNVFRFVAVANIKPNKLTTETQIVKEFFTEKESLHGYTLLLEKLFNPMLDAITDAKKENKIRLNGEYSSVELIYLANNLLRVTR